MDRSTQMMMSIDEGRTSRPWLFAAVSAVPGTLGQI
jgi:hypothetical protein